MLGTRRVYASLVCLAFAVLAQPVASAAETGFLNRVVTVGKDSFKYQVYVPENWNSNEKWPVILFFTAQESAATTESSRLKSESERPYAAT
jgi:hypothetical protein